MSTWNSLHERLEVQKLEIERLRAVITAAYEDLKDGNEASALLILKHAFPPSSAAGWEDLLGRLRRITS
jgi:hypothetical protein